MSTEKTETACEKWCRHCSKLDTGLEAHQGRPCGGIVDDRKAEEKPSCSKYEKADEPNW